MIPKKLDIKLTSYNFVFYGNAFRFCYKYKLSRLNTTRK